MMEVIAQSAALTLYTYFQLLDAERIDGLIRKAERFESARFGAVATWDGHGFEREHVAFRQTLATHPDPEVEERARKAALAKGLIIIERVIGGER